MPYSPQRHEAARKQTSNALSGTTLAVAPIHMSVTSRKTAYVRKAVARINWPAFFERLSRERKGWRASIAVWDSSHSADVIAREVTFNCISGHLQDVDGEHDDVSVELVGVPDGKKEHRVFKVRRVSVRVEDENSMTLELRSHDAKTTLIKMSA